MLRILIKVAFADSISILAKFDLTEVARSSRYHHESDPSRQH